MIEKHLQELNLSIKDISMKKVSSAYKKLALKFHPDKAMGLSLENQQSTKEKMQNLNEAYSYLSDNWEQVLQFITSSATSEGGVPIGSASKNNNQVNFGFSSEFKSACENSENVNVPSYLDIIYMQGTSTKVQCLHLFFSILGGKQLEAKIHSDSGLLSLRAIILGILKATVANTSWLDIDPLIELVKAEVVASKKNKVAQISNLSSSNQMVYIKDEDGNSTAIMPNSQLESLSDEQLDALFELVGLRLVRRGLVLKASGDKKDIPFEDLVNSTIGATIIVIPNNLKKILPIKNDDIATQDLVQSKDTVEADLAMEKIISLIRSNKPWGFGLPLGIKDMRQTINTFNNSLTENSSTKSSLASKDCDLYSTLKNIANGRINDSINDGNNFFKFFIKSTKNKNSSKFYNLFTRSNSIIDLAYKVSQDFASYINMSKVDPARDLSIANGSEDTDAKNFNGASKVGSAALFIDDEHTGAEDPSMKKGR